MSQAGIINVIENNPDIPIIFNGNDGPGATALFNTINILGDVAAAGNDPVSTFATGNSVTTYVQISQAILASDPLSVGLSAFNSAQFTVDPDGFVSLLGGGLAVDTFQVQAVTAPGVNPVTPTAAGLVTVNGAAVANHSVVLETRSRALNTYNLEIQYATTSGTTDATKSGVAHFDSSQFSVDGNGFVSLSGGGLAVDSFTPDDGTSPVVPTALGNVSVLGLSGSKVTGGTNTLTIKSPPFSQIGASATSSLNTGEFVTAAVTRTLPASVGLADGDLFIYVCTTADALVIQSVGSQRIRVGSLISAVAGSATSTAIGDSLTLRFNATDGFLYAISVIGTWTLSI